MDYDRYDAFLHHIFKQTQGDAWFRPSEDNLSAGVALRVDNGKFRVFPYENLELEPFETAVAALNPVVAVKVRSAAVHAALAEVGPEERSVYVDSNTRIQIVDTMLLLPHADKEQRAAFVRDERVLVVWSDDLDAIIPACKELEDRLIKLLWRSRPAVPGTPMAASSYAGSVASGHAGSNLIAGGGLTSATGSSEAGQQGLLDDVSGGIGMRARNGRAVAGAGGSQRGGLNAAMLADLEKGSADDEDDELDEKDAVNGAATSEGRRRWWCFGKRSTVRKEGPAARRRRARARVEERGVRVIAPVYNGIAAALAIYFMGAGINILIQEWALDNNFVRFALVAVIPLLFAVSLFFCLQLVQNISFVFGPVAQFHENSKYYSAIPPLPNKIVDNNLPHITIQMPVYKESLESVLAPSIESIKRAMQTYARQGGTSALFVNDDGLQLLPPGDRDARLAFYADHGIGWIARPKHDDTPGGFKRAGRFKKASNMNYALRLSLRLEKHLADLQMQEKEKDRSSTPGQQQPAHLTPAASLAALRYSTFGGSIFGLEGGKGSDDGSGTTYEPLSLEDRALQMAVEEASAAANGAYRPWAGNGKACRMGEIVLLVDSDTRVPADCLRDAARELAACPTVAVIQHESDVMQVAHHYFENGIAYFTRRINRCISITCANGEVAPFVGHNAFLRWRAVQDAAFADADGTVMIWSEHNVSEDFDMALRLMMRGYIIRWARYSKGGFKEGVSLTVDDELNRWQKYAYGCNELLFNPIVQWWRKGPINHQIHRFIWGTAPLHYKLSMMAYMFSYYGIAASLTIATINYLLLGWQFPVDGYYMHSFEIWLATTVVFLGAGTIGYTLLEYRLGEKDLLKGLWTNVRWIPFFFFFFGGMGLHLTQAVLAHLFSYNIQWSATKKEVERSNFFKEVPKIAKRFWFAYAVCGTLVGAIIVLSTAVVPVEWRVGADGWAVIFPLAVSAGCHILFPIVLNPWLMIFSY